VDRNGYPLAARSTDAKGDERREVEGLFDQTMLFQKASRSSSDPMPILEADKGYDCQWLRQALFKRGLFPAIPFRQFKKLSIERPKFNEVTSAFNFKSCRWVVERTFSWIKRQSRRLLLRWERRQEMWEAVVKVGIIRFWLKNLAG
jgi:hypothetical protein